MKLFRFLLFPFALLYDSVTTIRNWLYNIGVFKQTAFKLPIIVVGNLSVGGTGKTPQIEYLIRLLKDTYRVAVLSRGYKRNTTGFLLLNDFHTVVDVGDEPLQYFKKFKGISVAVDADRVAGVTKLLNKQMPEVILLDDAFQHRKIKGSFYILLTKYNDLFINDFLLPVGNLRESNRGATRASVILVTKCPTTITKNEQEKIINKFKKYKKHVFFTAISYAKNLSGASSLSLNELKQYSVLLITGIANPVPLTRFFTEKEIQFTHLKFPDHYNFKSSDIKSIKSSFDKVISQKKIIITTEKDYVRLEKHLKAVSFIGIETYFLNNDDAFFSSLINTHIKENQRL